MCTHSLTCIIGMGFLHPSQCFQLQHCGTCNLWFHSETVFCESLVFLFFFLKSIHLYMYTCTTGLRTKVYEKQASLMLENTLVKRCKYMMYRYMCLASYCCVSCCTMLVFCCLCIFIFSISFVTLTDISSHATEGSEAIYLQHSHQWEWKLCGIWVNWKGWIAYHSNISCQFFVFLNCVNVCLLWAM